jgi:hypothetical protein
MTTCSHIVSMAEYNAWMNTKLDEATRSLPAQNIASERQAFFGSIVKKQERRPLAFTRTISKRQGLALNRCVGTYGGFHGASCL